MRKLLLLSLLATLVLSSTALGAEVPKDVITIHVDAVVESYGAAGKTRWLKYGFMPSTIEIREGQTVTLELTSKDGTHSLTIPELGVKTEQVHTGQTTQVTFTASKAGTFAIECHADCGGDNKKMPGKLIVLPATP